MWYSVDNVDTVQLTFSISVCDEAQQQKGCGSCLTTCLAHMGQDTHGALISNRSSPPLLLMACGWFCLLPPPPSQRSINWLTPLTSSHSALPGERSYWSRVYVRVCVCVCIRYLLWSCTCYNVCKICKPSVIALDRSLPLHILHWYARFALIQIWSV